MAEKLKVLVLGREVSDFMCPMFKTMRQKYDVLVDLFEFRDKRHLKKAAVDAFDNILDIPLRIADHSKFYIVSSMLSATFIRFLVEKKSIAAALRSTIYYRNIAPVISNYDVVHVFFLTPELFLFYDALRRAGKVIVSMWGSDLFQCNEDFPYDQHSRLLNEADNITIHNKEMTEIFLSKFGRHMASKVSQVLIVNDTETLAKYSSVLPRKAELVQSFRKRHNIPGHLRIVVIGHAAHDVDNHVLIVDALAKSVRELQHRICLVFPMTYGEQTSGYIEHVRSTCAKHGFEHVILTRYMTEEEMIELRLASEVLLRFSKIDAFSLSLCETLVAANVCVTAAWLPYGKLRGNGVYCKELYEIDCLSDTLLDIVNNYDTYASRCIDNPKNVIAIFEQEKSVEKIYNIYNG